MKKFFVFLFLFTLTISGYTQVKELFRPLSKVELTGNTFTASQKDVINYSKNLPPTEATYLVRVNADLLKSGAESIIFNVPGAKPVTYKTTKVLKDMFKSNIFTWIGKPSIESGIPELFDTELGVINSNIRGYFRIDISNFKYRIEPVGDGVHIIVKQNIKKIPIIRSDDTDDSGPRRDTGVSSPHSTNLNRAINDRCRSRIHSTSTCVIILSKERSYRVC